MVRGHQVARAVTSLDLAEPRIPRPSGDRLRSLRAEAQLADLERQLVALRQLADGPRHRPAVRSNAVIDVRHDEREAELGREGVEEVEQRHGVGATRHRHEGDPRLAEEAGAGEVVAEARQQRRHPVV